MVATAQSGPAHQVRHRRFPALSRAHYPTGWASFPPAAHRAGPPVPEPLPKIAASESQAIAPIKSVAYLPAQSTAGYTLGVRMLPDRHDRKLASFRIFPGPPQIG